MIIYFSGYLTSPEIEKVIGDFGLLTSYIEQRKKKELKIPISKKIFLDSGAYSVSTGRAQVDIEEYISFIKKNKSLFEVYANLDVIGDAEKTKQNQIYMEAAGLQPLPTFHYGSDYNILREMVEKYKYLGLGGLVPISMHRKKMIKHLDTCFSIIRDKSKVHGWGITSKKLLFKYPFYSVDSTSWLMGGKFRRRYKNDGLKWESHQGDVLSKVMPYHSININNAIEMLKMVNQATQLWEKRGITYNE